MASETFDEVVARERDELSACMRSSGDIDGIAERLVDEMLEDSAYEKQLAADQVRTYARDDFVVSDDDSDDVEEKTALFLEYVACALALRPRRYEPRAKAFFLAVSTEPTFDFAAHAADTTALPRTIVDDFREICRASPAMQRLCALADDGYIPARVLAGGRRAKFVHVASNTVHVFPLDAPFNTHYVVETVALVYRVEWFAETLLLKELATNKYARCANVDVLCKTLAANTKGKFVAYIGERFEEMIRLIGE